MIKSIRQQIDAFPGEYEQSSFQLCHPLLLLEYKISVHFNWQNYIQTDKATAQSTTSESLTVRSQSTTRKEEEKKNKIVALDVALAAEKTNQEPSQGE